MATKKEPGNAPAPEPEPKKPVKEPGSVPDPTPEPEPEPSEIPERFQGKNLGQVIEMFEKVEKDRDRSGTEVGNLRKEVDEIKNTASFFQNTAQELQSKLERGRVKPEGEETPDLTGFYDNPVPLVQQVIQRELKKDRETRDKTEKEREYQRASMNFATGRGTAMKNNPELFRGIENQLEKGMWQYYQKGNVSVDELRDSKTWENGARMIHMANENFDRIVPAKVIPVTPTETEKPGTVKTETPEEAPKVELDAFGEEMRDHAIKGGMEEKDFNKLVKETKKREGR